MGSLSRLGSIFIGGLSSRCVLVQFYRVDIKQVAASTRPRQEAYLPSRV